RSRWRIIDGPKPCARPFDVLSLMQVDGDLEEPSAVQVVGIGRGERLLDEVVAARLISGQTFGFGGPCFRAGQVGQNHNPCQPEAACLTKEEVEMGNDHRKSSTGSVSDTENPRNRDPEPCPSLEPGGFSDTIKAALS